MYQWVISTLIVAVITVITTILTVKSTMRGYIVSPAAKGRLTSKARRYGDIVFTGFGVVLGILLLAAYLSESTPITRVTILKISAIVTGLFISFLTFGFNLGRLAGQTKSKNPD